ncbi:hypothetical protein GE061_010939 [Apolygus lucorum]|uniref:Uncharacterized protein n=1 Tax=Apolygus lucorum TaxID=248454 RepID=A0A8S9XVZ0_APOLU|nr:hypothetical protein GE061_010939 [Apolygus lucorum]
MQARTVGELKLKPQTINLQKIAEEWPFVKRGEVASMENAVPRVIIGQDNWPLIFPRKSFYGPWNGPVISMTWLGWVLYGKLPQKLTHNERVTSHIHFAHWEDVRDEEEDESLTELVAIEKVGTEEDEKLKPLEDYVAIDISDETTKRTKGSEKRETGLLLHDFESVPESRTAAKRLRTLERKMDRDSEFADANCAEMNECCDQGYARGLSPKGAERVTETIPAELSAKVQGKNMADPYFAYSVKRTSLLPLELRALQKKFVQNVFEANRRVLDILERSNADEWRWVPTKKNPADFATRTKPTPNLANRELSAFCYRTADVWNRRLSRLPWRPPSTYLHPMYQPGPSHALLPPMPMMGLFRQPPPAHLSETMYVAERTGQKLFPGQGGGVAKAYCAFLNQLCPMSKSSGNSWSTDVSTLTNRKNLCDDLGFSVR